MKDTVIVTGGCGFIASHVARHLLESGKHVVILDDLSGGFTSNIPHGAEFYEGSILNQDLLKNIFRRHSPRWVYHLAAYAAEGLSPFIRNFNARNNVEGSENLITAAINYGVECFVFTSSIAAYGDQEPPFTEETPLAPMDPYGAAKAFTEASMRNAKDLHHLNFVTFRPYNVFGSSQNITDPYRNVIGIFMRACLEGRPMTIFGDGNQTRAFSHISQVAPAIAAAVDYPGCWNESFNIGGATHYTVNHLADAVAKAMGVVSRYDYLAERHEAKHAFCSNGKAKSFFGNLIPDVSLEDGLEEMAEWAKKTPLRPSKPFQGIEITRKLPPSWAKLIS